MRASLRASDGSHGTAALFVSLTGLGLLLACAPTQVEPKLPTPASARNHVWFPLGAGTTHEFGKVVPVDGTIGCESCHPSGAASFTEFQCIGCHKHPAALNPRLHLGVPDYESTSQGCYRCHPKGEGQPFSHTGIKDECAQCHQVGAAFAALPKTGFTHPAVGDSDCGGCHVTSTWKGASLAPPDAFDPAQNLSIQGLVPSFSGTSIVRVTPLPQDLPMPMNHAASSLDAGVASACQACHPDSASGVYFPGVMHSSLANLGVPQPTRCAECHARTEPQGFVGRLATSPARTPPSGEMRHEAVAWDGGAPASTSLVPRECGWCHQTPTRLLASSWSVGLSDAGRVRYHAPLSAASLPQPGSCLDCHANSRPTALLTSSSAALPAGVSFDHGVGAALADCASCHAGTSQWSGGKFHLAGSAAPSTCLPCHAGERPTSTSGWASPYRSPPGKKASGGVATLGGEVGQLR